MKTPFQRKMEGVEEYIKTALANEDDPNVRIAKPMIIDMVDILKKDNDRGVPTLYQEYAAHGYQTYFSYTPIDGHFSFVVLGNSKKPLLFSLMY